MNTLCRYQSKGTIVLPKEPSVNLLGAVGMARTFSFNFKQL